MSSFLRHGISLFLGGIANSESRLESTSKAVRSLSIAPKPATVHEWQVRQQVLAEMRNEVDTFGIIEAGNAADNWEDGNTSDEDWDC